MYIEKMARIAKVFHIFLCLIPLQCTAGGSKPGGDLLSFGSHGTLNTETPVQQPGNFLLGADLMYVDEMEGHRALFKLNNQNKDPYELFAEDDEHHNAVPSMSIFSFGS